MKNYKTLVGILLFSIYFLILLFTSKSIGIFWDEPAYFSSSLKYLEWFKNPSLSTIDDYFLSYAPGQFELHPPLEKILQAGSYEIFYNHLGFFDQVTSFRFPNILISSLLLLAIYIFCLKYFNFTVALSSSLFLITTPRFFAHAHFAVMDVPMTFFVFLASWAFWKYRDKSLIIPGILIGLALSVKLTGLLFIIPFSIFLLVRSVIQKKNFIKTLIRLSIIPITALIILFILWPKLWLSPVKRLIEFFGFFSTNSVPFWYFGTTYPKPPWHYAPVMLGITTPLPIIFFLMLGILSIFIIKEKRELKLFVLINFLFLPVFISLPKISAYDAERLMLPSFPFMVILAGLGVSLLINCLSFLIKKNKPNTYKSEDNKFFAEISEKAPMTLENSNKTSLSNNFKKNFVVELLSNNLIYIIIFLSFLFSLSMLVHYYPFELSSYNLLIGGLKGAEKNGMEPQYSVESYKATLDFINNNCPENCTVYVYSNSGPYYWYQKDGLIRKDIKFDQDFLKIPSSVYFVVLPIKKSVFVWKVAKIYLNVVPVFSYKIDDVSIVNIYNMKDIQNFYKESTINF